MIPKAGDLHELVTASGHLVNTYGVRQETVFFPRYSQLLHLPLTSMACRTVAQPLYWYFLKRDAFQGCLGAQVIAACET